MEKGELFRRVFHMTAAGYLVYYLLPDELIPGFYKWHGVLIIMISALIVEGVRLKYGKLFFGLREYEKKRISAFAWFSIGMCIALLFFEMIFVVPVVIGMAVIDPLIGEVRQRKEKLYPVVPSVIYALIMFLCLLLLSEMSEIWLILFSILGTISAITAERWDLKHIDDDFLMIVIPLLVLSMFHYLIFNVLT
ncbi:MAG: hypothetical protein JSW00_00860 [Thermoplasmata archaeon]|nr:MAG: hypothetical protein JSW00_00860 [Thermoplasmata archaeon]